MVTDIRTGSREASPVLKFPTRERLGMTTLAFTSARITVSQPFAGVFLAETSALCPAWELGGYAGLSTESDTPEQAAAQLRWLFRRAGVELAGTVYGGTA